MEECELGDGGLEGGEKLRGCPVQPVGFRGAGYNEKLPWHAQDDNMPNKTRSNGGLKETETSKVDVKLRGEDKDGAGRDSLTGPVDSVGTALEVWICAE